MPADCVFCRIVSKQVPARVLYRDEAVICFLPKNLNAKGHTVIAPTGHYADIYDIPSSVGSALFVTAKMLAKRFRNSLGASGVNLLHASGADAQQSVFHFHIHLLPRFSDDQLNAWPQLPEWSGDLDTLYEQLRS